MPPKPGLGGFFMPWVLGSLTIGGKIVFSIPEILTMEKEPPYYAVIFISLQSENTTGYAEMALKMEALAATQKGYLGLDHARSEMGITISYWKTLEDIARWKKQTDHMQAQAKGKQLWYTNYEVQICKVERHYRFDQQ